MWGGPPGPRMGVKMAPISGSFWPSWRVGMSLWSGGACFSLPLLHLNSAMGRERSDGKLKLAPPARHVGFFRSRSIKIGLILTPMPGPRGSPWTRHLASFWQADAGVGRGPGDRPTLKHDARLLRFDLLRVDAGDFSQV